MVCCARDFDLLSCVISWPLFSLPLCGALGAILLAVVLSLFAVLCLWRPAAPRRGSCVLVSDALLCCVVLCCTVVSCCGTLLCVVLFSAVLFPAVLCLSGLFPSVSGGPLLSSGGVFCCCCPCLTVWPAALLCSVVCRGALLPCAVSSAVVVQSGALLWWPAVFFTLLVGVCLFSPPLTISANPVEMVFRF